ncbi:hypothetical protein KTR66_24570 [Roseococcus sp. SDR]|uniref:DUF6634 family protein n=1 Tax=Roseococcus sp. SDR TaxID=2835532 RepID=UPI001BCA9966|nr:DUF6634 family protein [Roseococcus sp. SDR]MBS7793172.1 hypothetical protein [Roseococcus sp. SDR]MBV1848486.1 hypothetical protein [Roseococcus sp. SDR]
MLRLDLLNADLATTLLLTQARRARDLAEALESVAGGRYPTPAEIAAAPVISSWRLVAAPAPYALTGSVTGHPVLGDTPRVLTSDVALLDPERSLARTVSRWYVLGVPASDAEGAGGSRH